MIDFNPSQLARRDNERLTAYRQNLDFYNGNQWERTSRNRQLVFNYARASIDKVTSYLMQGLNFACYPPSVIASDSEAISVKAKVRRAEQLLRQVYEDNNLQQLDWETESDAAVLGDGCYKVTWDSEEKRIRVTAPDISGIFAWWRGDDMAKVWRVASQYKLSREEVEMLYGDMLVGDKPRPYGNGEPLPSRERKSGGVYPRLEPRSTKKPQGIATSPFDRLRAPRNDTVSVTELWTSQTFDLFLDNNLVESKPNPCGFIPFIIFPNLREPKKFWGTSDIPSLIQPQRELNRALSQLSRILELSGNPIAVLENVGSAEDIKVQPGAVWAIPEDARAYLLDLLQGGGIRLHIDYIDLIYRTLHDISEMPRAAYGGIEKELSGAALNIELESLLQKVTRKRTIRTSAYHRRNDMILRLAEKFMGEDFAGIIHRVVWGPILPQDLARQAQNEQLLVQAGIHSRRTAMDEVGVQDPDEEFSRWLVEREKILEMDRKFRI